MPDKVAVIGAGISGLAVAVRLAAAGYSVDVFEKNASPGGKLGEIRHEGFRFDTGPSLFTLPELIGELYELSGKDFSKDFPFAELDTVCRYFYEDGMVINAFCNSDVFIRELHDKAGEDMDKAKEYLEDSRKVFDFTYPVFIRESLHKIRNYFSPGFRRAYLKMHQLNPFVTLHRLHSRTFSHANVVQLFDRFATYNGSDPYKTPATLRVIAHLEHNLGAYFPKNGMYQIATSLEKLGREMGVRYHYNCGVEEIMPGSRRSAVSRLRLMPGAETGTQDPEPEFDHIITDLDIWFVYKDLLKSIPFPRKWFRHERSTSALIFYWGMNLQSDRLDVHNILFSADYKTEFEFLFGKKTIYADPTVYIFISSKVVDTDAPEGHENWFVMINVPENAGQDWDGMIATAREKIETKIQRVLGIEVSRHRLFEYIQDPRGIEEKTASYRGSLYGNSSNSIWAAFQRHPNFSRIKGLYFTGGSVHPGGGIPLCLSSAKIVSNIICNTKKPGNDRKIT